MTEVMSEYMDLQAQDFVGKQSHVLMDALDRALPEFQRTDEYLDTLTDRVRVVCRPDGWETVELDGKAILSLGPMVIKAELSETGHRTKISRAICYGVPPINPGEADTLPQSFHAGLADIRNGRLSEMEGLGHFPE